MILSGNKVKPLKREDLVSEAGYKRIIDKFRGNKGPGGNKREGGGTNRIEKDDTSKGRNNRIL